VKAYDGALRALHEVGIPSVPHVLIGLHYGKIKGEFQALEMISKYDPAAVIAIAFTPIRGTVMEKVKPPKPEDIVKVLIAARLTMPAKPIVLGCMRPKGEHRLETDKLAVRAGVNAIAFPTAAAINLAEAMGLTITFSPLCCSQVFEDL
ncbi:MAG: radical SAM protein, partial [Candidatus Bathyarchaeia archaeon]